MSNEKEQLVGFTFVLMEEMGANEILQFQDREAWLNYPISGARQAANDMIEASADVQGKKLEVIDKSLRAKGLPTLTKMRDVSYKRFLQVQHRKGIKDEEEWRVLKLLTEGNMLDSEESARAHKLMDEYEFRRT